MIYILDESTDMWNVIWSKLAMLPINRGDLICLNEKTGDCWQYLSSNGSEHSFRHRLHPKTLEREVVIIETDLQES